MGLLLFCAFARVIITEVMSNVRGSETTCGSRNEYVEIYNPGPDTVDLADHRLSDLDGNPDEIYPWENDTLLLKYPLARIHSTALYPLSYALILDRDYIKWDSISWQPYELPDSVLVLTTDDHTLGDGLATNDPLVLFDVSPSCTTTFGTPYIDDGFPSDPGDGISWERIDLDRLDTAGNWHPSLDTTGGTPGRPNSTMTAYDLGLDSASIIFYPARLKTGDDVRIAVRIKNQGLRATADYTLAIYDDRDRDLILEPPELLVRLPGAAVAGQDSVALYYVYFKPSRGDHRLGFRIDFPPDRDTIDNLSFKDFVVSDQSGLLTVSPEVFTPNGDNIKDRLQIDYRLPGSGGELTIAVYDCRGKRVHVMLSRLICVDSQGTLFWDGASQNRKIPTGMYVVYLEYLYQNRVIRAKKAAALAR